jgi:hypothetical protein
LVIEPTAGHRREPLRAYALYVSRGGVPVWYVWHLDEAAGKRLPDDVSLDCLLIPLEAYPRPVGYESVSVLYVERFFEDGAR